MDDVKDLIDRLLVIYGEEQAGNNNYYNEKVAITKMLTGKFQDFIIQNSKGIPYLIRFLQNIPHTFWKSDKHGAGIINWALNNIKLPEIHLRNFKGEKYNFCGPFTKLDERLARGDVGINKLDESCKQHDIAYRDHKDIASRHEADKKLQNEAFQRVLSNDANISERLDSALVGSIMWGKRKIGMGLESNWQL